MFAQSPKNESVRKFVMFDIKDFQPSKQFLTSSLNFAETKLSISVQDKKIMHNTRKSL